MENATKALTMAASVLIALVVIGAILLVFNNLNSYQKTSDKLKKDEKVIEFNNQFETYNRTNVRGSDLISLINRVLDYNERQSSAGVEGNNLGYKPIKLTIKMGEENKKIITPPLDLGESYQALFQDEYVIYEKNNPMQRVLSKINEIEAEYGQTELTKFSVAISSIFLGSSANDDQKKEAVTKYNEIALNPIHRYSEISPGSPIRKKIYNYYEYIQFKRTYFDCIYKDGKKSGVTYDNNTGRITEMYFVGNGKVE